MFVQDEDSPASPSSEDLHAPQSSNELLEPCSGEMAELKADTDKPLPQFTLPIPVVALAPLPPSLRDGKWVTGLRNPSPGTPGFRHSQRLVSPVFTTNAEGSGMIDNVAATTEECAADVAIDACFGPVLVLDPQTQLEEAPSIDPKLGKGFLLRRSSI